EKRGKENFAPEELVEVLAAAEREECEAKVAKTPSKMRRSTRISTRNTANGFAARPTRVEKKAKAPKRKALGEVDVQKLYPAAPSTLTSRSPGSIAAGPNKKPLAEKLVKIVEED